MVNKYQPVLKLFKVKLGVKMIISMSEDLMDMWFMLLVASNNKAVNKSINYIFLLIIS